MPSKADIAMFLTDVLGCSGVSYSNTSDWVNCSCPLAKWKHAGGKDKKPSFGILMTKDGKLSYNCFACGSSGSIFKLVHTLTWLRGSQLPGEAAFLSSNIETTWDDDGTADQKRAIPESYHKIATVTKKRIIQTPTVPESVLNRYPLLTDPSPGSVIAARDWLINRRLISARYISDYGLRLFHEPGNNDIGIIFPIISKRGEVVDLWVRLIERKVFFRLKAERTGSKVEYSAPHLCFGWHLVDVHKPLFIVEGAIDLLRLRSLGVDNAVATFGSLSSTKAEYLYSNTVYLAFDSDPAGVDICKRVINLLERRIPFIHVIDWNVVGVKDPGELSDRRQIEKAVSTARSIASRLRPPRYK